MTWDPTPPFWLPSPQACAKPNKHIFGGGSREGEGSMLEQSHGDKETEQ